MSARARSACPPEPTRPLDTDIHVPSLCVFALMLRIAVIAMLLVALACLPACHAQSLPDSYWLNLGGISAHAQRGMNNVNPALAIEGRWSDELAATAGVLRNSQRRNSQFAAVLYTPWRIDTSMGPVHTGALVGAINGYAVRNGGVIPAGGLLAEWRRNQVDLSLVFVPHVSALRSSAVLTLMFKVQIP